MKFKVSHSVLSAPARTFKRGEIVTEGDLTKAGFDVGFLKDKKAIEGLEGTEGPEESPSPAAQTPAKK